MDINTSSRSYAFYVFIPKRWYVDVSDIFKKYPEYQSERWDRDKNNTRKYFRELSDNTTLRGLRALAHKTTGTTITFNTLEDDKYYIRFELRYLSKYTDFSDETKRTAQLEVEQLLANVAKFIEEHFETIKKRDSIDS